MTSMIGNAANADADLVQATLAGNRDAFGQIVARYQSLICSLAYSATGSLGQSEDLAQETFVAAWKKLGELREPEKLRAWLCGIVRNLINNSLRQQGREPSHAAESLGEISESPSPEPLPVEHTITNEEQAILWRSLEKIPATYREPLVLFYREHQSVEAVAEKLELNTDTVHQRLSRGRKLLSEEVTAFVEGTLAKSNPGKTFTLGVLAALPLAVTSAKAATVGVALAQGGAAAKGVATVGTLGGALAVLGGAIVSFRAHVDDAKSPRERRFFLAGLAWKRALVPLLFLAVFFAALRFDYVRAPIHLDIFIAAFAYCYLVYFMVGAAANFRRLQQIQIEDGTFVAAEWSLPRKVTDAPANLTTTGKTRTKVLRFMAPGIGMLVFVVTQEPWKENLGHAILMTALMVLLLVRGFWKWHAQPRFPSVRASWFVFFPAMVGLLTLFMFNYRQYLARISSDTSHIASPTVVVVFNLIAVLAYAAFVGLFAWKRRAAMHSTPTL